jgi:MoaA/NifB/PqqE/SkfB family radical SAM enzyme
VTGLTDRRMCCFSAGRVLLLSVTNACNQRCLHCMRDAVVRRPEPVDLALLRPALSRAVDDLQVDRVVISGGEPTLVPNLDELIHVIARRQVRPSLCTNALRMDRLADDYAAAGLRSVTVSIDGVGRHHDEWRGSRRGFARAMRGVDACVSADLRVTVNISLHDAILDHPEALAEPLNNRGLASVSVTAPMWNGRMPQNYARVHRLTDARCTTFVDRLRERLDCPVSIRLPRCDRPSCPSGRTVFAMDARGVLTGCPDEGSTNAIDMCEAG